MNKLYLSTAMIAVCFTVPVLATEPGDQNRQNDEYHTEPTDEIVVTAPFFQTAGDRLSGTSILTGDALTREIRPTIGETLARQPGVSSTAFGPNASRPVLRGFQGERVRVLTDGIGSIDVSNTSVDHAVAINPLTAQRIEILRGPSALLFGSSAIGGVVNVLSNRIPRNAPDEPVHVETIGSYGSATNERSVSGALDVPLTRKFILHFDGSYSKTDDLEVGGYVLNRALREQALGSSEPEIQALANLKDRLPNSAARTWEVAGGAAYVDDGGTIGISINRYDNLYALPVRLSLDPQIEAEAVRIDARQTRADIRAELYPSGAFIDKIKFRAAAADYEHGELDEDGNIGTQFFNDSIEARLELVQTERSGWKGASGFQYLSRDFDVIGDEAFIPKNRTEQFGVFALQQFETGRFTFEGGARYEHVRIHAFANDNIGNPDLSRKFDSFSGSIGGSFAVNDAIRLGLNYAHSERAPSAEELFPNGPHAGTQAFEIGNPDFDKEISNGLELTLNAKGNGWDFGASLYTTKFRDYIYETQTGLFQDGLPVFQFNQASARYTGFEVEGSVKIGTIGDYKITVDGLADMVRARIKNTGPVPRIPPLRALGGISAETDKMTARVEIEWSDSQNRVAPFETPTKAYGIVNASLSIKPFERDRNISITLSANNIFDVTARRHASFLKDFAPLSGRDLRVTARVEF